MSSLGIYLLVSLFFVVASFIEFGILLILTRTHFLGVRQTTSSKYMDNEKHKKSKSKKVFPRISKTGHNRALEMRYSVSDKIDFASFICFMFAYILFNVAYIIECAN